MNEIARSMSIRARANNVAKSMGIAPQAILQAYFAERFLARVSQSRFASRVVLKGGTLMSALFGMAERTTMDIDATVLGVRGDEENLRAVVEAICEIDADDGIAFSVGRDAPIRKDDEYGGFEFALVASLGTIRLFLGLDVTVGDAITPRPRGIDYQRVLGEGGSIHLQAYPMETLLAEKLQTILKRGALSTRPRDFYDVHKIVVSRGYQVEILRKAIDATFRNRRSEDLLQRWREIMDEVAQSEVIRDGWLRYQRQFCYAQSVSFEDVLMSVRRLFDLLTKMSE